jgi:hypothetical protein
MLSARWVTLRSRWVTLVTQGVLAAIEGQLDSLELFGDGGDDGSHTFKSLCSALGRRYAIDSAGRRWAFVPRILQHGRV